MSATGYPKICWGALPASIVLFAICAPAALDADPLSPSAAEDAFYNLACTKLARTLAAGSQEVHQAEIRGWIRICSAHPRLTECVATAILIRNYRKAPLLKCGQGIKDSSDIAASFLPSFDRVCANVTTAWLSNTEGEHRMEVSGWARTCNAHPDISVCKGAADLIEEARKVQPLSCGSNGD